MVTMLGLFVMSIVLFWSFGFVRHQSAFFRSSLLALARELDDRYNKLDRTLKSIEQTVDELSKRLPIPLN